MQNNVCSGPYTPDNGLPGGQASGQVAPEAQAGTCRSVRGPGETWPCPRTDAREV